MGNCLLRLQKKGTTIKLMLPDGRILRLEPPLKVAQALSDFPGHSISDELPVTRRHIDPEARLASGRVYYLLPPKMAPPAAEDVGRRDEVIMRVKLVVRKQDLEDMVSKGGVPLEDILSQLVSGSRASGAGGSCGREGYFRGWRPVLESIPEGNVFH